MNATIGWVKQLEIYKIDTLSLSKITIQKLFLNFFKVEQIVDVIFQSFNNNNNNNINMLPHQFKWLHLTSAYCIELSLIYYKCNGRWLRRQLKCSLPSW